MNNYNLNDFYRLIGDNIKKVRTEHNDSQESLAEKIDMSRGFLSQIESPGLCAGVSLDTLFKISMTYNIDIRDLFNGFEEFLNKNNSSN